MTTQALGKTFARPLREPLTLPTVVLGAAVITVLLGQPTLSLAGFGALLLWGIEQAGSPLAHSRLRGHAISLTAFSCVLAAGTPLFLPAAGDQLLGAGLVAVVLLTMVVGAPTVRASLTLRRPKLHDFVLLASCFPIAAVVQVAAFPDQQRESDLERLFITALIVLVPVIDEVLYRGLLMSVAGDSLHGVLVVALIQGLVTAAGYGVLGFLTGTALGIVFGVIRRTTGSWQSALSAHWGVAFGFAAPILMAAGVAR